MANKCSVAVIGLGIYGMSILRELSETLGMEVIGFDQYYPPHQLGSSHGDTRVTRLAIGEGRECTPFAICSHQKWKELELLTGRSLYVKTGVLIMASPTENILHGNNDFIAETISAAYDFNIPHISMNSIPISRKYPQFNLIGDETGYFEYEGGYIRPEECIEAQKIKAIQNKARIIINTKIKKIIPPQLKRKDFMIITDAGIVYYAEKVVVTAGAWVKEFLPFEIASKLEVHRQVLYWFEVRNEFNNYSKENFPVFIWQRGVEGNFLYGFPADVNGNLKIATEKNDPADPDKINRRVSDKEIKEMYKYAVNFLPDLKPKCVKSTVCMYTNTLDHKFIIDRHPDYENMFIVSCCSGHGAKHSAGAAESIAQVVLGKETRIDLKPFSLKRFKELS